MLIFDDVFVDGRLLEKSRLLCLVETMIENVGDIPLPFVVSVVVL
jgi:hypothetical protein